MAIAGARALFTATRNHTRAVTTAPCVAIASHLSRQRQLGTRRAFCTSAARPSQSDESNRPKTSDNTSENPATQDVSATESVAPSTSEQVAQTSAVKETTAKREGYGSFRARMARGKASEEMPSIPVPSWFLETEVSLEKEWARVGFPAKSLDPDVLEPFVDFLWKGLKDALYKAAYLDVKDLKFFATNASEVAEETSKVGNRQVDDVQKVASLAYWYLLTIMHHTTGCLPYLPKLRSLYKDIKPTIPSLPPLEAVAGSWWLKHVRPDIGMDSHPPLPDLCDGRWSTKFEPPRSSRPPPDLWGLRQIYHSSQETVTLEELMTRVQNEFATVAPKIQSQTEPRPVNVLCVMNYQGATVAKRVVANVAAVVGADVVHLRASTIANILGSYLGQVPYSSKATIAALGYAAAEINGRLTAPDPTREDFEGTVTSSVPFLNHVRTLSSKTDLQQLLGDSGERWEDLKIQRALEALIGAVDDKKRSMDSPDPRRPIIVHVHDYLELSTLCEGLVQKLRTLVDRRRQKGEQIMILGSSSSDVQRVQQWRTLLYDMNKDDCHLITRQELYHEPSSDYGRDVLEQLDNMDENLANIQMMIFALQGKGMREAAASGIIGGGRPFQGGVMESLRLQLGLRFESQMALSCSILDIQTVYRLASLLLSSSSARDDGGIDKRELDKALAFIEQGDKQWLKDHSPWEPMSTPWWVPVRQRTTGSSPNTDLPGDSREQPLPDDFLAHEARTTNTVHSLDKYEKKLLPGLIDAKDIRTTFSDIVAPEQAKDSIRALTTLSLLRPEAYTYGILKTERIPGLLLYGPPGTGKTLLAKAVAKESGANMLEITPATINDIWVGESEKNVKAVFSLARKMRPMIVFIDEGDALLGQRQSTLNRGGQRETITQFLREWDGVKEAGLGTFIIVATNRPYDLDEAVLRRLPRKLLVDLPLKEERGDILRILLRDETLDEASVSLERLAEETDLYSGSDLKNMCVAAAMEAVKQEMRDYAAAGSPKEGYVWPAKRLLTRKHFDAAMKEIGASASEDMDTLRAIKKFDEQYGDGKKRKKRSGMGFGVLPSRGGTEEARVRTVIAPLHA